MLASVISGPHTSSELHAASPVAHAGASGVPEAGIEAESSIAAASPPPPSCAGEVATGPPQAMAARATASAGATCITRSEGMGGTCTRRVIVTLSPRDASRRGHVGSRRAEAKLSDGVAAPAEDGTVMEQRARVRVPRRHLIDVRQARDARRHRHARVGRVHHAEAELAVPVVAPALHAAVL